MQINLAGQLRTLLVDSGSEVSILRQPLEKVPLWEPRVRATGVTGKALPIEGEQEALCQIGDVSVHHRFLIAEVHTIGDGLIGLDLMAKLGLILDSRARMIRFPQDPGNSTQAVRPNENPTDEDVPDEGDSERVVRATRRLEVPPYSEQMVEGKLKGTRMREIMFEPAPQQQLGIRFARSLNVPRKRQIWVRAINLTAQPIKIEKGQALGVAENWSPIGCDGSQVIVGAVGKDPNARPESEIGARAAQIKEKLEHLSVGDREKLLVVLSKYEHLFDEPDARGCTLPIYHRIRTQAEGPITKRPYRVPYNQRGVVTELVRDMVRKGVIEPSQSPWSAPVVLVPKKTLDGSIKFRFCTDFRALNQITRTDAYPLPLIVETLEALGESKYFTTLDLSCGYHQIPIQPEDCEKTAFSTMGGHYEYKRLAFGLVNAPATFQRLMDQLLAEIKGTECFVYLDDVIVFSASITEHCQRLERVFALMKEANLKIRLEKCQFAASRVRYLGHLVTAAGVSPDPEKVRAIKGHPVPKSTREVQSFLGIAGYYRRFIKGFANLAKPLTLLLAKGATFNWEQDQQKAFDSLREALCSEAVLIYPNFAEPFILATDASGVAIGAVLSQMREGFERPVAFASRQLTTPERNYSTTERELLAVVWATQQFRCYLLGRRFTLITDHSALRWMLHLKDPSARLTRWSLRLAEFSYEVIHRPGVKHSNADALSRAARAVKTTLGEPEDEWRRAQKDDAWCREMASQPNVEKAGDGLLYLTSRERDHLKWRILVPEGKRDTVMNLCHSTPWSGHPGVKRTCQRIQGTFAWPRMEEQIRNFVRACRVCQERRTPAGLQVPLAEVAEVSRPFEQVSLDIVGPLPTTKTGNRYMLTIIDWFSRYAEAVPLKDQTAEVCARAFVEHLILRHGAPDRVLTDQGRNFTSELFKRVCKNLGIKKLQTSAYHPQGNGLVERLHRTLVHSLACIVRRDGRDWDRWIPYTLLAYRSTPHSSTGYTPYFLVHGREPQLPLGCQFRAGHPDEGRKEFVEALKQRISEAYSIAKGKDSKTRKARAKAHDKGKQPRGFKTGEKIYLHEPAVPQGHARKFRRPWTGPHTILAQTSPVNYEIALASGGRSIVHTNRLKAAFERGPPRSRDQSVSQDRCETNGRDSQENNTELSLSEEERVGAGGDDTSTESRQESEFSTSAEESGGEEPRDVSWTPQEGEWEQTEASHVMRDPYELRNQEREGETPKGPDPMRQATPRLSLRSGVNYRPRRRKGGPIDPMSS